MSDEELRFLNRDEIYNKYFPLNETIELVTRKTKKTISDDLFEDLKELMENLFYSNLEDNNIDINYENSREYFLEKFDRIEAFFEIKKPMLQVVKSEEKIVESIIEQEEPKFQIVESEYKTSKQELEELEQELDKIIFMKRRSQQLEQKPKQKLFARAIFR